MSEQKCNPLSTQRQSDKKLLANCNIKIVMSVNQKVEYFDLFGLERRAIIQGKWDARRQRKRLNNAITPSDKIKDRKI